jgi:hypothetical protein
MLAHFADAGDAAFYRGGLLCAGLMTLFNLALLNDAVVTFVKWMPKPLPAPTTRGATHELIRELSRSSSLGSALSLSGSGRDRFRSAARTVIAAKRLSTVESDPSFGSKRE